MRGTKGGFWDRLFFRIRQLRIKLKLKKEKDLKEYKNKKKKENIIKKKNQQENFIYVRKINKSKGIEPTKIIITKESLQRLKEINTSSKQLKRKSVCNSENTVLKKIENKSSIIQTEKIKRNFKQQKQNQKIFAPVKLKQSKKKVGIETNTPLTKNKNIQNEKLIKEIRKVIEENKSTISTLSNEIIEIENKINSSISNDELNKLYEKLLNIKNEIENILNNYEILKYSNNLKELNVKKINELISEINNNEEIKKIITSCNVYLDYYNELSNLRINEQKLEYKTEYKKQEVSSKKTMFINEKIKLQNIEKMEKRLSYELSKQQNILNDFNKLISQIEPEKIVRIQSNYINNLLYKIGGIFTAFLSIPFLKKPKNIPTFAFGLYALNNSIKSMRGIVTKKTIINYIPSNDYARKIIAYRSDLNYIDYMLDDSLFQIRCLKEEYKLNFSEFYYNDYFAKQFEQIEAIEQKLRKQSKELKNIRNKYEQTLNKNNQKILKIEEIPNK